MKDTELQVRIERYRAVLWGDFKTLVLLVAQAPFIGWLCTIVWGSIEKDTPSLYFVLCLSAVWFGCINSCREVVKERAIVERERFFGLSLPAYILSKASVLGGIGLVQVVLLQLSVEWQLNLKGPMLLQLAALFLASLAGTGLGLCVSAVSARQERAVGAVPLLILPQILFSEFTIPESHFGEAMKIVEKLMPVRWAYRVFEEAAATEPQWLHLAGSLVVLMLMAALLHVLAMIFLIPRREVV
jgi:ABC-type multidrug transport system permease subunit